MKQFVKALDGEYFQHIASAYPELSFDKIKAGVFDKPQIRSLARDEEFVNKMNGKEKEAWLSSVAVARTFLGNVKADNYHVLITTKLLAYRSLGCRLEHQAPFPS